MNGDAKLLDPSLRSMLAELRARIRRYVAWRGMSRAIVALVLAFWLSLAIDWIWEPHALIRMAMWVAAAGAVLYVLARDLVLPLFARLPDSSLALLIERRFKGYRDSLLTAVEIAGNAARRAEVHEELLAQTVAEAKSHGSQVELASVLKTGPLRRSLVLATLLLASVVGFAVAAPEMLAVWTRRVVQLSGELWPRRTRLVIQGFKDQEAVIARGADLPVIVQADTAMDVPVVVEVRSEDAEGTNRRDNMVRVGNATTSSLPFQDFKHIFGSVMSDTTFDVAGGDARLQNLRIRVVDAPAIDAMQLACTFPTYTGRAARALDVTGAMQLPLGTRVTLRGRANKDLLHATLTFKPDPMTETTLTHQLPATGEARNFEFELPALLLDQVLSFQLLDRDGIENREPIRLSLSAIPDAAPQLKIRPDGIGSAITPQARLPLSGQIEDDYGIRRGWIEYQVDELAARKISLNTPTEGRDKVALAEVLEVAELDATPTAEGAAPETSAEPLRLVPGQRLLITAKAQDAFQVVAGDTPNIGQSDQFQFDVVTPEQLRAMLEARELNLRQRFEAILEETLELRDSLAVLEIVGEVAVKPAAAKAVEPAVDDPDAGGIDPNAPERVKSRSLMRLQSAEQSSQKTAEETLGVGISFEEIRAELVNNRLDSEELKIRLQDQIADPLKAIGTTMLPALSAQLEALEPLLTDATAGPTARRAAVDQADKIIVAMQQVRDKMLELETFNEALDMLRGIIAEHDKLHEDTKAKRKQRLADLLKEDE